jgi:uncharacterized coiled-coil DUF342 family protein
MRRPHRSIETFDISLMAVVTKAMGAFLVLMLLLMPYYSSSPLGKDEAQELARKVQDVDAKIKGVLDRLAGSPDLGKDLETARENLGDGAQLIAKLKQAIDQMSAQVARLEDQVKAKTDELAQAKKDLEALNLQLAQLKKERDDAKAELEPLKTQINQLQADNKKLKDENEALNKKLAELGDVAKLKTQIEQLQKDKQQLQKEKDQLQKDNDQLISQLKVVTQDRDKLAEELKKLKEQKKGAQTAQSKQQLMDEIEKLKKEKSEVTNVIAAQLYNVKCDVPLFVTINSVGSTFTLGDGTKTEYTLSYSNGMGAMANSGDVTSFRKILVDTYFVVLTGRSPKPDGEKHGSEYSLLQRPRSKCTASVAVMAEILSNSHLLRAKLFPVTLDNYSKIVTAVTVHDDGSLTMQAPSPDELAWLNTQIDHAEKAPYAGPLTPEAAPAAQPSPPEGRTPMARPSPEGGLPTNRRLRSGAPPGFPGAPGAGPAPAGAQPGAAPAAPGAEPGAAPAPSVAEPGAGPGLIPEGRQRR